jgi:hypothetical protein
MAIHGSKIIVALRGSWSLYITLKFITDFRLYQLFIIDGDHTFICWCLVEAGLLPFQNTASVVRTEMRDVRKYMVYVRIGDV